MNKEQIDRIIEEIFSGPDGQLGEHPTLTDAHWRSEIDDHYTRLGYKDWLRHKLEEQLSEPNACRHAEFLIDWMRMKAEAANVSKYFTDDDAQAIRDWTPCLAAEIAHEVAEAIATRVSGYADGYITTPLSHAFYGDVCPFCIAHKTNDFGATNCQSCEYGAEHKICNNPYSDWCGVRDKVLLEDARMRDKWETKHGKQFWGMALELATNYMEGEKS